MLQSEQEIGETGGLESLTAEDGSPAASMNDDSDGWQQLMGKDLLLKVLDGSPENGQACQAQDAVVVDIVGRLADNKDCNEDGPIFHQVADLLIVVGEKDVHPALEMGIRFLQVGQRGLIWSHSKFAYGPATRRHLDYELPPNSNVCYRVTLKSIVGSEEYSTAKFQLDLALSRKKLGNDLYENEWSNGLGQPRCLRMYQRVANDMQHLIDSIDDGAVTTQAYDLMIDCLNNVTAVHLRSKSYHSAKEAAIKVLSHDPDNFKALIRAARAALDDPAGSFEEVEAAIFAAEKVNSDDVTLKKLHAELRRRKHEYKKKSRELFSNFWSNDDAKEAKTSQRDSKSAEVPLSTKSPKAVETEKLPRSTTDWIRWIAPYTFQLLLPFVVYLLVMRSGMLQDIVDGKKTN